MKIYWSISWIWKRKFLNARIIKVTVFSTFQHCWLKVLHEFINDFSLSVWPYVWSFVCATHSVNKIELSWTWHMLLRLMISCCLFHLEPVIFIVHVQGSTKEFRFIITCSHYLYKEKSFTVYFIKIKLFQKYSRVNIKNRKKTLVKIMSSIKWYT